MNQNVNNIFAAEHLEKEIQKTQSPCTEDGE